MQSLSLWAGLLTGVLLLFVVAVYMGGTDRFLDPFDELQDEPKHRLHVAFAGDQLRLRWNGLVNSWRLPGEDVVFNTEMQLPLIIRNEGYRQVRIEAWRLLTQETDRRIEWQAVGTSREVEWESLQPIEPQIQQAREPLTTLVVESGGAEMRLNLDLVPVDYAALLERGSYQNRLQVRMADTEEWRDLLSFDFTVPDDFALSGRQISRYQYWQTFALDGPAVPAE